MPTDGISGQKPSRRAVRKINAAPPPIRLTPGNSKQLIFLLVFAHAGALICLICIQLAWPIRILLGIAVIFGLFLSLCQHGLHCWHSSITTLLWTAEGVWQLGMRDGSTVNGELKVNTILGPSVLGLTHW